MGLLQVLLCDRIDKKWVMVAGFAIFTVSAVFGAQENIYAFVTLRCFATGVGWESLTRLLYLFSRICSRMKMSMENMLDGITP